MLRRSSFWLWWELLPIIFPHVVLARRTLTWHCAMSRPNGRSDRSMVQLSIPMSPDRAGFARAGVGLRRFTPLPLRILFPQLSLEQLAGRRMRQVVDEDKVVGHLPFGELCAQKFPQLVCGGLLALLQRHHGQRALLPLGMGYGDHSGLAHRGMA